MLDCMQAMHTSTPQHHLLHLWHAAKTRRPRQTHNTHSTKGHNNQAHCHVSSARACAQCTQQTSSSASAAAARAAGVPAFMVAGGHHMRTASHLAGLPDVAAAAAAASAPVGRGDGSQSGQRLSRATASCCLACRCNWRQALAGAVCCRCHPREAVLVRGGAAALRRTLAPVAGAR